MSARRAYAVAGSLLVVAVVWVLVNKPVEGPTLVALSRHHGITVADLLSVLLALAAALVVLWPHRSRRRSDRREPFNSP